jgi:hypothetical protein
LASVSWLGVSAGRFIIRNISGPPAAGLRESPHEQGRETQEGDVEPGRVISLDGRFDDARVAFGQRESGAHVRFAPKADVPNRNAIRR